MEIDPKGKGVEYRKRPTASARSLNFDLERQPFPVRYPIVAGTHCCLEVKSIVNTICLSIIAFVFSCLLAAPTPSFAQATSDTATAPNNVAMAASSNPSLPSLEDLGLSAAPVQSNPQSDTISQDQNSGNNPNQKIPPASNAPSLSDLGFTASQTQGNAQEQALLNKRTHMLKVHQTLGLITAIPMAAALITGPQAKAKGKNGQTITEPTSANLDFHIALGGLTTGLYWTTAYYAIFAPKIPGVKPKGAIRLHRDLEWVHGPGMILKPILGIMAYKQENSGEKAHGIASYHGTAAYVTAAAYGASIVAVSWPIHWKFWEGR